MKLRRAGRRANLRSALAVAAIALLVPITLAVGASGATSPSAPTRPVGSPLTDRTIGASRASDVQRGARVAPERFLDAARLVAQFPSSGGTFIVRLRNLPPASLCQLSAGSGIRFRGTYRCGGRLFEHIGRVLPNASSVVKRWTVRALVKMPAGRRHFAWVVAVGASTPAQCATGAVVVSPAQGEPSCNWSGYVLRSAPGTTTDVEGTWTVPTLDCAATPNGDVSDWVGVDGVTSLDLFQAGTRSYCLDGTEASVAWFEELPASEDDLASVSAGDTILTHLWQVTPGKWNYSVTDETTGETLTSPSPIAYGGPETSAEWINEDPSTGNTGSYVPLADFGTVAFSAITADGLVPPLSLSADGVVMVQNGSVVATPSAPSGTGFTVSYG